MRKVGTHTSKIKDSTLGNKRPPRTIKYKVYFNDESSKYEIHVNDTILPVTIAGDKVIIGLSNTSASYYALKRMIEADL